MMVVMMMMMIIIIMLIVVMIYCFTMGHRVYEEDSENTDKHQNLKREIII